MGVICPHCGANNGSGGTFCMGCGKPLRGGLHGAGTPKTAAKSTAAGAAQREELEKRAKHAFFALLAVAILMTLVAFLTWIQLSKAADEESDSVSVGLVVTIVLGVAGVFYGLAFWARSNPLPAAIIGLTLFCTIVLFNAVIDPETLAHNIGIKIVLVAALVAAIQAGVKHRQLVKGTARA
jgi:hypothetical protein